MGESLPKQYLELAGHPLLHHTLHRLATHPRIAGVFVVLAAGDTHFGAMAANGSADAVEPLYCGERLQRPGRDTRRGCR